jgi:hypothetical protein
MDSVVRVTVAHDEACEEYQLRAYDRHNPPVPVGGSRLIDELAVVPRAQKWAGRCVGAGAAALLGVVIGGNLARVGTADVGAFVPLAACLLACAAFAAAWTLGVVGVVKRQRRLVRGLAAAEEVWRHGWYCRRCDVVYFQPGYAPPGVDPRTPLDTGDFRRIVFAAGGYADLA